MSIPKSSLDNEFPDNSEFQATDSLKAQENLNKKAIQGKAIEGKSNAFTTVKDTLLYHDGESIGSTVMESVVAPAMRDLSSNIVGSIFDMIVDSINRMIYKNDPARAQQRGGYYSKGGNGYVPYSSIFNNPSGYYNISPSAPVRSGYSGGPTVLPANPTIPNRYSNIILENRGEAETFVDDILYHVNQYQSISVANVYAKLDWPSTFQDTKWGWTPEILNPNTIIKRRASGGMWRVILPRPIALDI